MNETLKTKCELFAENRQTIGKAFKWEEDMEAAAAALIFTAADKPADTDRMKECEAILKKKTGVFSSFRTSCSLFLLSKMALSDSPEKYLDDIMALYDKIKKGTLSDNSYMVLAACILNDHDNFEDTDAVIEKFKELRKTLDKKHPLLFSSSDLPFLMQMVLSGRDMQIMLDEIEQVREILAKNFKWDKRAVFSLSQVLVLTPGDIASKCEKIVDIYDALKNRGVKYGKDSAFTSLGALIDLDIDIPSLADEIIAADKLLADLKGFGGWSMDSKHRLMFAATLAADVFRSSGSDDTGAVLGHSLAVILAEEIAVVVSMTIMMTAVASSSN